MTETSSVRYYRRLLSGLPKRLTVPELMRRLDLTYMQARTAAKRAGYQTSDGRKFCQRKKRRVIPEKADWTKSNADLARLFKVSRERVRQIRNELGKPFVESRGRHYNHSV